MLLCDWGDYLSIFCIKYSFTHYFLYSVSVYSSLSASVTFALMIFKAGIIVPMKTVHNSYFIFLIVFRYYNDNNRAKLVTC